MIDWPARCPCCSLASNPYFVASMFCLVNGAVSALCIYPELKYSVFICLFAFNGVVAGQYAGCCDAGGTALYMWGKVVPTALGSVWAVSACMRAVAAGGRLGYVCVPSL